MLSVKGERQRKVAIFREEAHRVPFDRMKLLPIFVLVCLIFAMAGCATPRYAWPEHAQQKAIQSDTSWDDPRELPMFVGHTGSHVTWQELLTAIDWAEIIILGEQHDDAMAHAVQLAVVEDTFDRWPRSALSLEMLERDEQILVDDFLDDIIDTEAFIRLTFSANWGGEGSWVKWFQPIIDAAKERHCRVIAANAPRRYVRMARLQGYGALDALPRQRRALFDRPAALPRDGYFERFSRVMSHVEDPAALDAIFRSQMVWDATMARSILQARPTRTAKVVHLVGRFHSDFEGGLVQQIRRHRPNARILVLSMNRADSTELGQDDVGRADVVVYTGEQKQPDVEDANDDDRDAEDAPVH